MRRRAGEKPIGGRTAISVSSGLAGGWRKKACAVRPVACRIWVAQQSCFWAVDPHWWAMAAQHAMGAVVISLAVVQLADRTIAITALITEPIGRKVRFNNARMTTRGFSRVQAGLSNARRRAGKHLLLSFAKP